MPRLPLTRRDVRTLSRALVDSFRENRLDICDDVRPHVVDHVPRRHATAELLRKRA